MNTRDLTIPPTEMECYVYADEILWKLQAVTVAQPDDNTLPIGDQPNSPLILVFVAADFGTEPPEHLKQIVQEIYDAQAKQYRLSLE